MEIEEVFIEYRPSLQCSNFFILFNNYFQNSASVNLVIKSNKLIVEIDNQHQYHIITKKYFKLHTQTLSLLIIKKNYITFRLNTNENEFGSEILDKYYNSNISVQNNNFEISYNNKLVIRLASLENYKIKCKTCQSELTDESVNFRRILELPADNLDTSDWFCHKHDHGASSASTLETNSNSSTNFDMKTIDVSKNMELYYGYFYFLLNRSVVKNVLENQKTYIHCKRCLQFLGEAQNTDTNKFWYENIIFYDIKNEEDIMFFQETDILNNFLYLIKKCVNDLQYETLLGLPHLFKILFKTNQLNGRFNFLFIQIMDKKLNVFRKQKENNNTNTVDSNNTNENYQIINVDKFQSMKVLYKYLKNENSEKTKISLLEDWHNDNNVNIFEISNKMFNAAIEYLGKNSNYVPECYRQSSDFALSYLYV